MYRVVFFCIHSTFLLQGPDIWTELSFERLRHIRWKKLWNCNTHTATQRWPVSTSSNRSTCWLESLDSIQWARSWSSSRTAVADFSGGACEGTVEVAFAAATTCLTRVLPLAANTRWVVAQAKILQQLMIHHIRTFSNRLEGFKGPELLESNSELSSQFLHFRLDIALHFLSALACSHLVFLKCISKRLLLCTSLTYFLDLHKNSLVFLEN